ncbi:hypothetical protein AGMMS49944_08490 [Spirochaetia bacterium]|nr:hypothetical protein AGMMS49944_08490 [Spirochaetia bacterium]
MKTVIQGIISKIEAGVIFDAHTIIEKLIQEHSDVYLSSYSNNKSTELYNSQISKIIDSFDGSLITRMPGESWSKNIRDNFSNCAYWKKN